MTRWLKSLFAWRFVADTGVWRYEENSVTRKRRAYSVGGGHQPRANAWLLGLTDHLPGSPFLLDSSGRVIPPPRGEPAVKPPPSYSCRG